MSAILLVTIAMVIASYAVWTYGINTNLNVKTSKHNDNLFFILAFTAFVVRVICAVQYRGHSTDMGCFDGWSSMIFNDGLSNFYTSDAFHDYPPGYMYVLYIVGFIRNIINPSEKLLWLIIKAPAIICDILTAVLIYKIALKQNLSKYLSSIFSAVYLFNPAIILNSSLWGQVDSVYTLFIAGTLYLLTEKKLIKSFFMYAVCIFIKPQAFMFAPLIIFALIENTLIPKADFKKLAKYIGGGLCAIVLIMVLALPFGIENVFNQYVATLESYPYLTVNAFNLWGAFGQNWTKISGIASFVGYFFICVIVAYSAYVFFKSSNSSKYYFAGAILSFATFMLSTKMHDRYAFPAMVLLLAVAVMNKDSKSFLTYVLMSLSQFFNTAWVLFIYEQDINKYFKSPVIAVASWINIALFVIFIIYTQKYYIKSNMMLMKPSKNENKKEKKLTSVQKSTSFAAIKKHDVIFMAALMIIYGGIAFYNLGDTKAPQTEIHLAASNNLTIDLGEEKDISSIMMYLGARSLDETRTLDITYFNKTGNSVKTDNITSGTVFYWNTIEVNTTARYITLSSASDDVYIKEICITDNKGKTLAPINSSDNEIAYIFDEQSLKPERATFMNSTYFDEIYHARTAYEFVHGMEVYEWTHPPLGKVIISLGVKIFGMTPFGWRFMGTLFGVLMIPIIYVFAKKFFKYSWVSMIACVLLTFDFMHLAQTRIATIDVYVTFFIMLMYMFMFKYYSISFYDTDLRKTFIPLGLCGISTGLAIASKWTGVYAAVGLAIIFFITIYRRYKEYIYAKNNPNGCTNGIEHKTIIDSFVPCTVKTIIFCCIFFIAVPVLIYLLSYIPYLKTEGAKGFKTIIGNQVSMYTYHAKTVVNSTHPYSSRWYEWIIMKRPIWYYSGKISETVKEGISSFGNPAVWWVGIPAFIYMVYIALRKKDKKALFLIIAYLAQLVSWIPVTRTTYIYHYFPSVPFIVMMISYAICYIYNNCTNIEYKKITLTKAVSHTITVDTKKIIMLSAIVYAAITIGLFILFYPVLSGAPCSVDFAENWLKWFDSWVLL